MPKKCKCPEPEEGSDFMTTFADMVTLLLCFFVLLFSMASIEDPKFIVLLKGLEENFGNSTLQEGLLNGGASLLGANMADGSAIPVPGGSLRIQDSSEEDGQGGENSGDAQGEGSAELDGSADQEGGPSDADATNGAGEADNEFLTREELEALQARLEAILEREGRSEEVTFRFDERGLVISVAADDVLFGSGSAELQEQADGILEILGPEIASFPNTVFVDGHTDDLPFPGTEYTNRELSAERAVVVARELEDTYGIEPQRLIPAGYGEWRPIAENTTEEGRALNRRVELVVAAGSAQADTGPLDGPADDSADAVVPEGAEPEAPQADDVEPDSTEPEASTGDGTEDSDDAGSDDGTDDEFDDESDDDADGVRAVDGVIVP